MRRMLSLLLAGLALLLSGCMEGHSLDRYGYVIAIGFDSGETMPYKVSFMVQKVDVESGSQKKGGFQLVTAEAHSLFQAVETASSSLPYQLDFARTSLIVFERALAEQEGELYRLTNVSFEKLRVRYNANVFISMGKAEDALAGFENDLDPNLSKMQMNFVTYSNETGLVPVATLTMLFESMKSRCYDLLIPLCGLTQPDMGKETRDSIGVREYAYIGGRLLVDSDMKTNLCGAALFSDRRMAGVLDGQHTQLILLATGNFRQGRIHLALDGGQEVDVLLKASAKPVTAIQLGSAPSAAVTIRVTADLENPERMPEIPTDELERQIARAIETELSMLFQGCRALDSDAFGFGKAAIQKFSDAASWEAYDFNAVYRALDASFTVFVDLAHNAGKSALE